MFTALHTTMGQGHEFADFCDERLREHVLLRGIFGLFIRITRMTCASSGGENDR